MQHRVLDYSTQRPISISFRSMFASPIWSDDGYLPPNLTGLLASVSSSFSMVTMDQNRRSALAKLSFAEATQSVSQGLTGNTKTHSSGRTSSMGVDQRRALVLFPSAWVYGRRLHQCRRS